MACEATSNRWHRQHPSIPIRHTTGQLFYPTAGRWIVLKGLERHKEINLKKSLKAMADDGLDLLRPVKKPSAPKLEPSVRTKSF